MFKNTLLNLNNNRSEIYLGFLLFIALPVCVGLLSNWVVGVTVSVVMQSVFIFLSLRTS